MEKRSFCLKHCEIATKQAFLYQ